MSCPLFPAADIEDLLLSWGIPSEIQQNFTLNGITIEHLSKLSTENLKELCPHLGHRLIIQEKIIELLTATAPTETTKTTALTESTINSEHSNNSQVLISLEDNNISFSETFPSYLEASTSTTNGHQLTSRNFPTFDLHTLLQTSAGGNSILKFYETSGFLNNNKRNQLTDIIIKHIYTYIVNHRISYEEYNLIAAKIITLFPKESIGTYFTKPIKKINSINGRSTVARGKLVDKVRNLLYKYGDRKKSSLSDTENDAPINKKRKFEELHDLHAADIIWLKINSEPWEEVIEKWKKTFNVRKDYEFNSINEIYIQWKILKDSRADTLINTDFDLLYPEKGLNLYLNWEAFYEKLIKLRPTKDEKLLEMMQSLQHVEDDSKITAQIHIIGHLVPPKGRLTKKIKFTTQEAIESLFICVENSGDIDFIIEQQKQKAKAKKISVQPFIILQGSIQTCKSPLLVIDDVKYKFTSITKAFDILFKTYHVFHARYPKAGDHLYLMFQKCVYRIDTKYDNVVSYITDIINYC